MDENLKDVLLASLGVVGTLGGIGLGAVIEGRHRHDSEKRDAYARFAAVTREVTASISKSAEDGIALRDAEAPERVAHEVWMTLGVIQLVGGGKVLEGAELVHHAIGLWLRAPLKSVDEEGWLRAQKGVAVALEMFLEAARKDLGVGR